VLSDEKGKYSIDLIPGAYNVTVNTTVEQGFFSFEGKLLVRMGEGTKSYNISMKKHSVTVSGFTRYENTTKANISINFVPDIEVENNPAVYASTSSNEKGEYKVELRPGFYNVTVFAVVSEEGVNVTYTFKGYLEVSLDKPSITYDIALTREET
jgi:hypothetical protein